MNTVKNIIIGLIFASWIILVATFSIQNIDLVSLKFFFLESIQMPIGVLLSTILGFGFIFGAVIPLFFTSKNKVKKTTSRKRIVREAEPEPDPIFDWE